LPAAEAASRLFEAAGAPGLFRVAVTVGSVAPRMAILKAFSPVGLVI
jgi:hypothetical protein